jgi:hypothetical protein
MALVIPGAVIVLFTFGARRGYRIRSLRRHSLMLRLAHICWGGGAQAGREERHRVSELFFAGGLERTALR